MSELNEMPPVGTGAQAVYDDGTGNCHSHYTTESPMTMIDAAFTWLDLGAALIPLQPGSKHQVAGWGAYLDKITDRDVAWAWFVDRRCNLGVICAGSLVCLDFDDETSYRQIGAGLDTLTERTKRGFHVFVWANHVRAGVALPGVEIKAGGAVVTVCPSVVGGLRYTVVKPLPIQRVDLSCILPGFSFLSESPKKHLEGKAGGDLVSRCKQSFDILQVAQALQAARGLPPLRERRGRPEWWAGRCPFHSEKNPSYFVNVERGFYKCLACGARGDVLNLYQALHGLPDIQTTINQVARGLVG